MSSGSASGGANTIVKLQDDTMDNSNCPQKLWQKGTAQKAIDQQGRAKPKRLGSSSKTHQLVSADLAQLKEGQSRIEASLADVLLRLDAGWREACNCKHGGADMPPDFPLDLSSQKIPQQELQQQIPQQDLQGSSFQTRPTKKVPDQWISTAPTQQEEHEAPHEQLKKTLSQAVTAIGFVVILVNTVLVGFEVEMTATHQDRHRDLFRYSLYVFASWYTFEIVFHAISDIRFFVRSWRWNLFDAILLAIAYLDIFAVVQSATSASSARVVRMLRIGRMGRVVRLARTLKELHAFCKLSCCMIFALEPLVFTLALMSLIMYVVAVIFTEAVAENNVSDPKLESYFGNLSQSMLTLMECVSSGRDWAQVFEAMRPMHAAYKVIFVLYVSMTLVGVMSLITSVFVRSTVEATHAYRRLVVEDHKRAEKTLALQFRDLCHSIDEDNDGMVTESEFKTAFEHNEDVKDYFDTLGIDGNDVQLLFRLCDADQSGCVPIDEFVNSLGDLTNRVRAFDMHCLIFRLRKNLGFRMDHAPMSHSIDKWDELDPVILTSSR
eukprot:TRINITY_DN21626_c0_g1_i1.p1 TRINITY_DN21626_c0_g1~~TRINITY_DN21626_c0_g1_i1.p1  ORF type:complete len:550 (-),score=101.35 TRINITY_DN21626_c0_g1_i1:149-1798(-)